MAHELIQVIASCGVHDETADPRSVAPITDHPGLLRRILAGPPAPADGTGE
jgi:hypothetical protein